jgi:triosephosphate isomerase
LKRKWLFGTNWKMNKTAREAAHYAAVLRGRMERINRDLAQVFVLPPYTSIEAVKRNSADSFWVGAQNMHWEEFGPYTGEISAPMLAELGIDLVQLGHAERRAMFLETDAHVNRKLLAALRAGFRPLVCFGEPAGEREPEAARETCVRQLRIALDRVPPAAVGRIILAYEPAWAIGVDGIAADPDYVCDMTVLFRQTLGEILGPDAASSIPILYGGSVSAAGAPALLAATGVDGLFVGRAALDPEAFATLIESCLSNSALQ